MPSSQLIALTKRLIANIDADRTDLGDSVYRCEGAVFTDPVRFERERQIFFRRTPQVFGWAGEVSEPGEVLARVIAGVPVLVTMDEGGERRAFLNACAHRGMPVCEGADQTRRLTCSYHGWTFDLAGRLVGVPARDRFPSLDLASTGLEPLPIEAQAGLLVVGLRPDVDLTGFLDPIVEPTAWMGYDRYRGAAEAKLTKQANWKLMVDTNIEAYHLPTLHRDTLFPFLSDHCTVDRWGPHSRLTVPFKGLEVLADQPESTWPDRIDAVMVTTIFPATLLVDHMDGGSILRFSPGSHVGETDVTMVEARPRPVDEAVRKECEDTMEVNLSILDGEDFPAVESCQRGYAAGARSMIAGLGESLVGHWHETWDAALAAADPRP